MGRTASSADRLIFFLRAPRLHFAFLSTPCGFVDCYRSLPGLSLRQLLWGAHVTAFQLTANPFWLLETSPRARREDIIEAFEEAVSAGKTPEQELLRAQQTILTPKTRLDAELAWLPELSPTRAKELAATLSSNPSSPAVKPLLEAVDGLAKANLAADLCSRFPGQTEFAKALAESYRTFDTEVIESTINAARGVAGFATVNREMLDTSLAAIEAIHAKTAVRCLSGAPQPGDALRQLLEGAGDGKPRELLDAVAREYGGWAEIPLREIGDQIRRDITGLRDRPDEQESVTSIKRALTRWSGVIGPLQALERDKGLDEPRSKAIYDELRVLCLWLVNEQNLIVPALEISRGLLAAFSALPTVSNQVADDIDTLQRMAADAQTAERMAPLLSAAQEVRSNLAKLDSGLTGTEFGPKAKGLAKVLFDAFVLAVDASADSENASVPWTIVRSLAIELNNNAEAEEAALEMVVGLLAFRGGPSDPEIRAKLEEDRRTIRSNTLWNTIKWHLQRNEMNKALPILESLIAETPPKTEQWQNLFSCRQDVVAAMGKARNKKIKGW